MSHILILLNKLEAFAASACYGLVAFALVLDVLARELFNHSIFGIQRAAVYLVIATAYLGMGLATGENKHLRPRFADGWLPASWQTGLKRLSDLVATILFALMGYLSLQLVATSFQWQDQASMLNIPLWTLQWVMPYGFLSCSLRYAMYFFNPSLKPQEAGGEA